MSEQSLLNASRRRFLASVAAVVGAGATAGCSSVEDLTSQEFEADWSSLNEEARAELALAATFADAQTITREGEAVGVDGEVTITNKAVAYERDLERLDAASDHRPTLLDSFVRKHNQGRYRGALVYPGNYRITGSEESGSETDVQATLVVPTGAVAEGTYDTEGLQPGTYDTEGLQPGTYVFPPESSTELLDDGTVPAGGGFVMPIEDFLPVPGWNPSDSGETSDEMRPRNGGLFERYKNFFGEEGRVLVLPGENSPDEVFGRALEEMPGQRVEEGENFQPFNPYLAVVASEAVNDMELLSPDEGPWPLSMGGVGYGVGVLASPNEEVGGQAVSPLAEMDLREMLTSDQARGMVDSRNETPADGDVEWLSGPMKTGLYPSDQSFTMLDEEAEIETFAGIRDGENISWLTFVHVARIAADDVVVLVGSHAVPVGEQMAEDELNTVITELEQITAWTMSGAGFSGLVGDRLSPSVPDHTG